MRNQLAVNSNKLDQLQHGKFGIQSLYNEVANISRRNYEISKVIEKVENFEIGSNVPSDVKQLKINLDELKQNRNSENSELNSSEAKSLQNSIEALQLRLSWLENVMDRK